MLTELHKSNKIIYWVIVLTFFSITFLVLLDFDMNKDLDHDEHQFVASGKLYATNMLIPYKDYPYFHMPNLVFIYAAIFKYTDHIFFAARFFNVVCALFTLVLIFYVASTQFSAYNLIVQFLIGAGSVILLATNPVFTFTNGIAWNHDLPALLVLLAFLFHCYGAKQGKAKKWVFLSGIFFGLGAGTRLTVITAIIPFVVTLFLYPAAQSRRDKFYLVLSFSLGLLLSLTPSLLLFVLAPKQFIFGNIGYAELHKIYSHKMGYDNVMTLGGKFKVFINEIIEMPANLMLYLLFIFIISSTGILKLHKTMTNYFEIFFILLLIPFILIASFMPAVPHEQYFFMPIPFLVLGIVYGMASFRENVEKTKWGLRLFAFCVIASSIYSSNIYFQTLKNECYRIYKYHDINKVIAINEWKPVQIHQAGIEIANIVHGGRVLTLAPIFPLEGGAEIYEEFATGPFAWRTAGFLPENERKELGVISKDDLNDFLKNKQPEAILVGMESEEMEKPFEDYGQQNGYKLLQTLHVKRLWVSSHLIASKR